MDTTKRLRPAHRALLRREGFVPCKFLLIKETSQDIRFLEIKTRKVLVVRV